MHDAGPSLIFLYAIAGFFGYLILRQLGELVAYRPSSGSFVSYTREFYGEKWAFFVGWMYWFSWAATAIVDATAIAIYFRWFGQYLPSINDVPQWVVAFVVIVLVVSMNLISVKIFGELEFWFALVKVCSLLIFMVVGILFLIFGTPTGTPVGITLISESGFFPNGLMAALIVSQGVIFAYSGIELVGTASGEIKDPRQAIPKAINTVIWRIALFYVGSVLLLSLLLPYDAYSADESPFVTFFGSIGVDYAAPIMQLVVITAAASSLNAGLYSTGRITHSMAINGSAPKFTGVMNTSGVPVGGILLTGAVALLGVIINYWKPSDAFEIVLNISAICIVIGWMAITLPHLRFVALAHRGERTRPDFRAPLAPFTNWLTMFFLVGVLVLIAYDYPIGTYSLEAMALVIPLLVLGWFMVRTRVKQLAQERQAESTAKTTSISIVTREDEIGLP